MITLTGARAGVKEPTLAGTKVRIEYQNKEKGGVNGRQIELVVADDASDMAKGLETARELVENEGVFAVLDVSSTTSQSGEYLFEKDIPVVGYHAAPVYGKFNNFFGFSGGNTPVPTAVTTGGEYLKQQGVTKLGVITYSYPESITAGKEYVTSFEAATGNEAWINSEAPPGNVDWSLQALAAKKAGIDGVYFPMALQDSVNAYQALLQAGIDLKAAIFPAGYGLTVLDQLGEKIEGASFTTEFVPLAEESPASETMLAAMKKYAGDEIEIRDGLVDRERVIGWLIADSFINGLEKADDCPTREGFIETMRSITDYDADGLLNPPVDYSESLGRPYSLCTHFVKVIDGEFVTQDPSPICGEIVEE